MSIPMAFLGVVLIWSTTPLTIKWSSEGPGFLFGVTARMLLGVLVCLVLSALMRQRLHWHRDALLTYLAAGLGIWGAMTCVYWGAQYISSGLVAVVFGISPVVTAMMAALWLRERSLTPFRLFGMALGIAGLGLVFAHGLTIGPEAGWGILSLLLAVHVHAASSVGVKRIAAHLPALETTTGSLLVAVPLFLLNWWLMDGRLPRELPARAAWSIAYLGIFGSALGFILYYHVLRNVQASRVALITLMTPVIALYLGQWINDESVQPRVWLGTTVILCGLACFQWGEQWLRAARTVTRR